MRKFVTDSFSRWDEAPTGLLIPSLAPALQETSFECSTTISVLTKRLLERFSRSFYSGFLVWFEEFLDSIEVAGY